MDLFPGALTKWKLSIAENFASVQGHGNPSAGNRWVPPQPASPDQKVTRTHFFQANRPDLNEIGFPLWVNFLRPALALAMVGPQVAWY